MYKQQLFFYYTLIAHEWKPAQNSLINLFQDVKSPFVKDYYNFVSSIDTKEKTATLIQAYKQDLPAYVASHNRYQHPNAEYIWVHNRDTEMYELWRKEKEMTEEEAQQAEIDGNFGDEYDQAQDYGFSVPGYYKVSNIFDTPEQTLGSARTEQITLSKPTQPVSMDYIMDNNGEDWVLTYNDNKIASIMSPKLEVLNRKDIEEFITMENGTKEIFDLDRYLISQNLNENEDQACPF